MEAVTQVYNINCDLNTLNNTLKSLQPIEGYNAVKVTDVRLIAENYYMIISVHYNITEGTTSFFKFW